VLWWCVGSIDVAVHDRRGGLEADAVSGAHHVEPAIGADLVRTEHRANLIVQDLGRGPRQRAEARRLQRRQELANRDTERCRALMHLER
jgi:hypothetical protein